MKLSEVLRERGYVYQHSSEKLEEITDGQKRTLYLGVDPTADSMHAGQLQGILVLRRFVEDGHKLIIIVGGGTGMIGDPGGRSTERNLLDDATVELNTEALRKQFTQLLGGVEFKMVNNAEWLHKLNLLEFLRDIGKFFSVNEMIKRDSVRPRLETPDATISFTEFSYMLLQAYDYLKLHQQYACDLQVGGSDQWGNILSGVELIRRTMGDTVYAFSWPLLVDKKTGKKFGKSEGNAVWLDPHKTSSYLFYQFWFNSDDEMVEELLLKMTLLQKSEIAEIIAAHKKNPAGREAQKRLATAVTTLVHGDEAAKNAAKVSEVLFGGMDGLSGTELEILKREAPSQGVKAGASLVDTLTTCGLATSKREARQYLSEGAVSLNGKTANEAAVLSVDDFASHGIAILKRGKRNACVLTLS